MRGWHQVCQCARVRRWPAAAAGSWRCAAGAAVEDRHGHGQTRTRRTRDQPQVWSGGSQTISILPSILPAAGRLCCTGAARHAAGFCLTLAMLQVSVRRYVAGGTFR